MVMIRMQESAAATGTTMAVMKPIPALFSPSARTVPTMPGALAPEQRQHPETGQERGCHHEEPPGHAR